MKDLERHIKDIARNDRATVTPGHVAGFEQFLKDRKRRRKWVVVWWVIGIAGLSIAGLVLGDVFPGSDPATKPTDTANKEVADQMDKRTAKPGLEETATDAILSPSDTETSPSGHERPAGLLSSQQDKATSDQDDAPPRTMVSVSLQTNNRQSAALPTVPIENEVRSEVTAEDPITVHLAEAEIRSDLMTLRTIEHARSSVYPHPDRALQCTEPAFAKSRRWRFGARGAWFPLFPDAVSGAHGMAYQGGLFAGYRLSPLFEIRLDGGFTLLDGGVAFRKEASHQELLFRAQTRMSTLEAQQFYAYHGGASFLWTPGRGHRVSVGLQALHIYAAKGDVERITEGSDGTTITEVRNDTWVATSGIKRNLLNVSAGYHRMLSDVLQIGVTARIPVIRFGAQGTRDEGYLYSADTYRLTPQVSLYYFIQ